MRYHSVGQEDPSDVLRDVNKTLYRELEDGMFATSSFLVVDTQTNEVFTGSAGHMPPLVRKADGSVVEVSVTRTPPLGVNEMAIFRTRPFRLEKGETAVLYTDGISEATKAGGELFGLDRLVQAIAESDGTTKGVMETVLSRVRDFVGDEEQSDDIT